MTKLLDEKLEGMDDVVLELVRCKTENENLKNKVNELNKENFKLKNNVNSSPFCEKRCKITALFGYMQKKV